MKEVLTSYQFSSGQSIDIRKSKLFLGNCSRRTKRRILAITNLQDHILSSTYLRAPLTIGTPQRQHFNPMLDRFFSKISWWKFRLLSLTGAQSFGETRFEQLGHTHLLGLPSPQVSIEPYSAFDEEFSLVCGGLQIRTELDPMGGSLSSHSGRWSRH